MKKLWWVVVLAVLAYAGYQHRDVREDAASPGTSVSDVRLGAEASGTQVQGSGVVARILPDDDEGSRSGAPPGHSQTGWRLRCGGGRH